MLPAGCAAHRIDCLMDMFANYDRLDHLPVIERFAAAADNAYIPVLSAANSNDFAVSLRALLCLGRMGDHRAIPYLLQRLREQDTTVQRLMTLDALLMLSKGSTIPMLTPIEDMLLATDDDLFLRGLIWYFGAAAFYSGQNGLEPLVRQILSTHHYRRVRDELIEEAVFLAAHWDRDVLLAFAENHAALRRWLNYRYLPEGVKPMNFMVYPSPDYLRQEAALAGVDGKLYKRLHFWHRDKTANYEKK